MLSLPRKKLTPTSHCSKFADHADEFNGRRPVKSINQKRVTETPTGFARGIRSGVMVEKKSQSVSLRDRSRIFNAGS